MLLILLVPTAVAAQEEASPIRLTGDAAHRERYAEIEGKPAPALRAERWFNAEDLDLDALEGRVVLLDFWGVWCAPCVKSTRQLIRLHDLYESRGLTVIGVHTRAGSEGLAAYVEEKGLPYPTMVDAGDATAAAYRVDSFPTASLIDYRGRLRYADVEILEDGLFRGNVERAIRRLLDERDEELGPLGPEGFDTRFVADVSTRLEEAERAGFSGYVAVQQRGRCLVERKFGWADRELEVPWARETVSTVGSLTKQFTAAAVLRLQEQERLSVRDSIAAHLEGVPADKQGITLHHLLTHTSGIRDLENLGDWDPVERDEFVRRILESPLGSEPGTRYVYSNAGYSLLGAILERVTGESYEEVLAESVLEPAGLERTGYLLPGFRPEELAVGYRGETRWGTVLERPMAEDGPYWGLRANGGIHSTPADMLRWGEALLEGRVLSPESLEAMWTPWVRESEDAPTWYGYGWTLLELPTGERVAFHNGSNGVYYADFSIAPQSGTLLLVMTNALLGYPDSHELLFHLGDRLLIGPSPTGW